MSNINKFYDAIETFNMSGEEVANLFTNFHGNQLVSDGFIEFLEDEGYDID